MKTMTDTAGRPIVPLHPEPRPGSIVLVHGEFGTAWQRQFSTGLWTRAGGGRARDWAWLMTQRNVLLAYAAPVRDKAGV